eukprot:CFRG7836T1
MSKSGEVDENFGVNVPGTGTHTSAAITTSISTSMHSIDRPHSHRKSSAGRSSKEQTEQGSNEHGDDSELSIKQKTRKLHASESTLDEESTKRKSVPLLSIRTDVTECPTFNESMGSSTNQEAPAAPLRMNSFGLHSSSVQEFQRNYFDECTPSTKQWEEERTEDRKAPGLATSCSESQLFNLREPSKYASTNLKKGAVRTPMLELKLHNDQREGEVFHQLGKSLNAIKQDIHLQRLTGEKKVVVFMCGLPARGKSFISKKLARYLRWMGYDTEVFNVGNLRRERKAEAQEHSAKFFDPNNANAKNQRDTLALDVLDHAVRWLQHENGQVAIHDATNSNIARRRMVYEKAKANDNVQVIFIESICNDPVILENNINLKLQSPDYKDMDPVQARADFLNRLKNYESAYETLTDQEGDFAYIKVINVGGKVVARNISSFLPGLMCTFLMNMHLQQRPIWLTRHGESLYNMQYRVGGDTKLSPLGRQYARAFAIFVQKRMGIGEPQSPPKSPLLSRRCTPEMHAGGSNLEVPSLSDLHNQLNSLSDAEHASDSDGSQLDENGTHRRRSASGADGNVPPIMSFTPCASPKKSDVVVWTSTLQRATETSSYLPPVFNFHQTAMLNEIFAGRCEGMTYAQIMNQLPMEFLARARDKLRYRYPNSGESYIDVVERVRPLVTELERTVAPIVIVGHMASLRAVYAYFMNVPLKKVPYLNFPLHTAVCLSELPFGMKEEVYQWRPKEDGIGSVWEYLPNYSVTNDLSDGDLLQSVANMGEEYNHIDDADFQQVREKAISELTDEQRDRLEGEEYYNQHAEHLSFARETSRECKWEGCEAKFNNHPAFVAHVISAHCSSGGNLTLDRDHNQQTSSHEHLESDHGEHSSRTNLTATTSVGLPENMSGSRRWQNVQLSGQDSMSFYLGEELDSSCSDGDS